MRASILAFVLLFGAGPAYAQILIERDGESGGSSGGGFSAPGKYKMMDYNVGCKKDLEYTNVHIHPRGGAGGVSVSTGADCDIVLRDCRVDGSVIANKKGNITLERCEVYADDYSLWVNGSGSITLIDSVVHSKKTSVLIHKHASGNVNLIRSELKGGKTDLRGKGRLIRSKSKPSGLVIPKPKDERIPRKGFKYQPEKLSCSGTRTKTASNLHFDKKAIILGGDKCDVVVDGCIFDSDRMSVVVVDGNITLKNCEIRAKEIAIRLVGKGSITIEDSTISSSGDAIRTLSQSTGNVTLTRTKILKGKLNLKGLGKVIK